MDPITTAIVAALAVGATSGVTEAGKQAIVDAYNRLKSLLQKKFGSESEVIKAVEGLEKKPDSPSRQGTLNEEVVAIYADQDSEILYVAQALLTLLKDQPSGKQHIQTATGNYIAQSDRGSTSSVNVTHTKEL